MSIEKWQQIRTTVHERDSTVKYSEVQYNRNIPANQCFVQVSTKLCEVQFGASPYGCRSGAKRSGCIFYQKLQVHFFAPDWLPYVKRYRDKVNFLSGGSQLYKHHFNLYKIYSTPLHLWLYLRNILILCREKQQILSCGSSMEAQNSCRMFWQNSLLECLTPDRLPSGKAYSEQVNSTQ